MRDVESGSRHPAWKADVISSSFLFLVAPESALSGQNHVSMWRKGWKSVPSPSRRGNGEMTHADDADGQVVDICFSFSLIPASDSGRPASFLFSSAKWWMTWWNMRRAQKGRARKFNMVTKWSDPLAFTYILLVWRLLERKHFYSAAANVDWNMYTMGCTRHERKNLFSIFEWPSILVAQ